MMRGNSILLLLIMALPRPVPAIAQKLTFNRMAVGRPPNGWTIGMTHSGGPPKWEILKEMSPDGAIVLAQLSSDPTAGRFPLAVWNGRVLQNGTVSVKFKTISGVVDQGAGLIWRYQDENNYYIVRANALEGNIVLYKVEHGERLALPPTGSPSKTYGVKHRVPPQTWCMLAVTFTGDRFIVRFNGEDLFRVTDRTFTAAGKTGLWTKADSVIYFDDFEVSAVKTH